MCDRNHVQIILGISCSQRNGADFSVFVNVANEFDGSDSGARPDEAVSWGKIKKTATPVKVSQVCQVCQCAFSEKEPLRDFSKHCKHTAACSQTKTRNSCLPGYLLCSNSPRKLVDRQAPSCRCALVIFGALCFRCTERPASSFPC